MQDIFSECKFVYLFKFYWIPVAFDLFTCMYFANLDFGKSNKHLLNVFNVPFPLDIII